jgi:hypothetical protein
MPRRPTATAVLLALAAGALVALTLPGTAAAQSCAQRVIDDWSKNGRLTRTYPAPCLRAALKAVPEDLRDYSSISDDINAALQAQLGRGKGLKGSGPNGPRSSGTGSGGPARRLQSAKPSRSLYRKAIDNLGTSNADSLPIPLIVLASLGGLLLLSAAGLAGAKRIRSLRARSKLPPPAA